MSAYAPRSAEDKLKEKLEAAIVFLHHCVGIGLTNAAGHAETVRQCVETMSPSVAAPLVFEGIYALTSINSVSDTPNPYCKMEMQKVRYDGSAQSFFAHKLSIKDSLATAKIFGRHAEITPFFGVSIRGISEP
jgi:hypothetical protein